MEPISSRGGISRLRKLAGRLTFLSSQSARNGWFRCVIARGPGPRLIAKKGRAGEVKSTDDTRDPRRLSMGNQSQAVHGPSHQTDAESQTGGPWLQGRGQWPPELARLGEVVDSLLETVPTPGGPTGSPRNARGRMVGEVQTIGRDTQWDRPSRRWFRASTTHGDAKSSVASLGRPPDSAWHRLGLDRPGTDVVGGKLEPAGVMMVVLETGSLLDALVMDDSSRTDRTDGIGK